MGIKLKEKYLFTLKRKKEYLDNRILTKEGSYTGISYDKSERNALIYAMELAEKDIEEAKNKEAKKLWKEFSNIPVDGDDYTETDWHIFYKGTLKFDIWHWFEKRFNLSVKDGVVPLDGFWDLLILLLK